MNYYRLKKTIINLREVISVQIRNIDELHITFKNGVTTIVYYTGDIDALYTEYEQIWLALTCMKQ
jgi:hypothetical protein